MKANQKKQEEDQNVYARESSRSPIIGGQNVGQHMGDLNYGPNDRIGNQLIIK